MIRPVFRKLKDPGPMFLDSGAFGLYAKYGRGKPEQDRYRYFKSKKFKRYVDNYAKFVLKWKDSIDYYANVDVLYNPEMSWKILKYLERKYDLSPIPVIHSMTPIEWVEKHVDAGYDFIGLGGRGTGRMKELWKGWADQVFTYLCPASNDYLPLVRVHGFALTSHEFITRFPWFSADSTSWVQAAAWGNIFVPAYRNKQFVFTEAPRIICVSPDSPTLQNGTYHYLKAPRLERKILRKWLKEVNVPLGQDGEWGVMSEHNARKCANCRFFQILQDSLPQYPWPFKLNYVRKGLL